MLHRREFILKSGMLGAGFVLPLDQLFAATRSLESDCSPEAVLGAWQGSPEFTGDSDTEAHEIFWNKPGFLERMGGIPRVSESRDLVIVGGGIAGLTAAYYAAGRDMLLLDGDPRFGGNSKLETFAGASMGLGAAYIVKPEEGGDIAKFLQGIGLDGAFRADSAGDYTVGLKGAFFSDFWSGTTDPANSTEFRRVLDKFTQIYNDGYPELPLWASSTMPRAELDRLDQQSFQEWLNLEIPGIHPHILEFLIEYCWSSFCGGIDEISAAQALNFITSDLQGTQTLPGGNGGIAKAVFRQISQRGNISLAPHSFAVNIQSQGAKTDVTYFSEGRLKTVQCNRCIVAIPKFAARHVIAGLPADQDRAMDSIGKRAYLVGNVLLKRKVQSPGYDCYTLHNEIPTSDRYDSTGRAFSDIAFADWPNLDSSDYHALTLFVPQPYDGAQQLLFSAFANEKHQGRIMAKIPPYLASLGIDSADIAGIRLTRYGHAIPVAAKGQIANGVLETAHRRLENIVFAGQCNWANPCFETAFETGRQAALAT
jgi:hypothetical protein